MESNITTLDLLPVVREARPYPGGPSTCLGTCWRPTCLGSRFDAI
ncbi:hypothetical protein ACSDR0_12980 [Streptosporangium sp. G11]|jgi:hypothetical protein